MTKGRLEAFSDGVIAIIITIMVLEMKVPHGTNLSALKPMVPVFFCYALSYIYVGIYWSNHHHTFHAVKHVNGPVLWANLHLLFWLSLIPFVTRWMGENHLTQWPVAVYGIVLLLSAIAYYIMIRTLIHREGMNSPLAEAIGSDFKGKISILIYVSAILLTFLNPQIGFFLYVVVALIWIVPDRRIEKKIN